MICTARRSLLALPVGVLAALAAAGPALASNPPGTTIGAPAAGSTTPAQTYTGSIPTSSNPTSECPAAGAVDTHTITWTAQADPLTTRSSFTVKISWTPSNPAGDETANDEVLTIFDAGGNALASSDGSDTSEAVTLVDPKSGTYTAVACGYANTTPQPYTGTVTATSVPVKHAPAPVAESGSGQPGAGALPEARYVVALPLLALAGAAAVVLRRRRRTA